MSRPPEVSGFVVAFADDQRRRQFADVVVHRDVPAEPLRVAAATLARLPGCWLVAVPTRWGGCVLAVRDRPPVVVVDRVDVEACAAAAYSALLSLARSSAALGSPTWS